MLVLLVFSFTYVLKTNYNALLLAFLSSSAVEQLTVNQLVVGSIPT